MSVVTAARAATRRETVTLQLGQCANSVTAEPLVFLVVVTDLPTPETSAMDRWA